MAGLCEGGNEPPGSLKASNFKGKKVATNCGESLGVTKKGSLEGEYKETLEEEEERHCTEKTGAPMRARTS
ncbi:hypothetical protein ANN_12441 [Periplaneta americana]|uniref:Uncharacterized protein n=1 Tax=Periplaneta americana TaxID=6978 RepID=A0ABQ8TII7_PERAM|nr:hypothetical protein ANN_12441 [Periplaneta americana]